MSMRYLGGFISASYNPLKVPNAPTIGVVTVVSGTSVSVAFTAPTNVGGSAITSYTVLVTDSSSGATFTGTGTSSPITVSGLTTNNTYTAKVLAVNSYGPSAFSAPSGSFIPSAPKLYSWGNNPVGALGLNLGFTTVNSPTQVGSSTNWAQVSGGDENSGAVKTDGTLWTWGSNNVGQLGQNYSNVNFSRSSPVQIGALTDWSQLTAGYRVFMGIKTTGALWSWGRNNYGELGQNIATTVNRSSPVQVGSLTNWAQSALGNGFCISRKTDGTLWSWGGGTSGRLGLNDTNPRSSPVQVGSLTDWAQVDTGFNNGSFGIKTNGTLWSWGGNSFGMLGQNTTTNLSSPVQVGALTDWARVSAGNDFCTAIKTNGTLWSWGSNYDGRLGLNDTNPRSSPVQVGALTNWSQISTGVVFCVAVKTDGTLWSWGGNIFGQLGQGSTILRSSPVQVGAVATWARISAGSTFVLSTLN